MLGATSDPRFHPRFHGKVVKFSAATLAALALAAVPATAAASPISGYKQPCPISGY